MSEQRATGFQSVFDFRLNHSWLAAIGFYFFYLVVGLAACGLLGGLIVMQLGVTNTDEAFKMGITIGRIVAFVYCVGIYAIIIHNRGAWKNLRYLAGLFAAIGLSILVGCVGGMVPAAVTLCVGHPNNNEGQKSV